MFSIYASALVLQRLNASLFARSFSVSQVTLNVVQSSEHLQACSRDSSTLKESVTICTMKLFTQSQQPDLACCIVTFVECNLIY